MDLLELNKYLAQLMYQDLEEALKLCEQTLQEELPRLDYLKLVSTKIKILQLQSKKSNSKVRQQKLEEALESVEELLLIPDLKEKYLKNYSIAMTQKRDLLVSMERKEEALVVNEELLSIPNLKEHDLKNYGIEINLSDTMRGRVHENSCVGQLLMSIYADTIPLEEIQAAQINQFEQLILQIAYYEKHNKKQGLYILRQAYFKYADDCEKRKILNRLKERLSSKKGIFDCFVYAELLNIKADFSLLTLVETKSNREESGNVPLQVVSGNTKMSDKLTIKSKKEQSKIIQVEGKRRSRYDQSLNCTPIEVEQTVLLKDVFEQEFYELGIYLYQQMHDLDRRENAIQAWDKMQNLMHKSVRDSYAFYRAVNLFWRTKETTELNRTKVATLIKTYYKEGKQ